MGEDPTAWLCSDRVRRTGVAAVGVMETHSLSRIALREFLEETLWNQTPCACKGIVRLEVQILRACVTEDVEKVALLEGQLLGVGRSVALECTDDFLRGHNRR